MELLTKMELQHHVIDKIDEMFKAPDAETFQNILTALICLTESLPQSRWYSPSYFEHRIEFWKGHLPAWMNWKYVHGHPLALRWLARDVKITFCYAISHTVVPGTGYTHTEMYKVIDQTSMQLA